MTSDSTQHGETHAGTTYATSAGNFPKTSWTMILAARSTADAARKGALDSLCQGYWYPVYAYIRRRGQDPEAASDLTQDFFLCLLTGTLLDRADPGKGRFRAFLLNAVQFFLADQYDKSHAQKRGGGALPFSLDDAELFYQREPSHEETPERIFERRWAWALLDRVVNTLRDEFVRHGRLDHFNHLRVYLVGQSAVPYAELAAKLDVSESALKSGIHRFRRRYRELLREEVANTVEDPADVDAELRFLLLALSTKRGA